MQQRFFSLAILFLAFTFLTTSCSKYDDNPSIVDSSIPNGVFSVERSGSLTAENGTPTAGTVELGQDEDNVGFLRFGSDFTTQLATGTVSVYLSTSAVFTADPGNGNPDLILLGPITGNGEQYLKLNQTVSSSFTHVILWCNTAGIPFGNGPLQ